jgi:hypothetical protein
MKKNLYKLRFLRLIGIFIFLFGSWGWLEAQNEYFKPMPFQELLIDFGGETVLRTEVGIRVTILQGVDMDSVVYQELHLRKKTNNNGMVSFVIGEGLPATGGVYKAIDFADGPYFIKREYDLNAGSDYTIENTSQMVSVPFAMHATLADTTLWAPYPWQDSLPSNLKILTTNADETYSWISPEIPIGVASEGQFLSVDSSGTISWVDNKLPSFPQTNKVLGVNSSSSFEWMDEVKLPTTGGSGDKPYNALGHDGTNLSLIAVDTVLNAASGTAGQILVYDVDNMEQKWVDYDWKLPETFNKGDVLSVDDTGEEIWIGNTGIRKLSLGPDSTLGGVVFKISADSTHALVAAFRDLNVDTVLESTSLMIDTISWYGAMDIVSDSSGYDTFGKDFFDWRLPTREEFLDLNQNSDITLSSTVGYWTSTQDDDYQVNPMELRAKAWYSTPPVGAPENIVSELKFKGLLVRPVRLVRYR